MSARTRNNATIVQAVVAVARAHARIPGVDYTRSIELARKLDVQLAGHINGECVIALSVQLLRALGVADPADSSRLRS